MSCKVRDAMSSSPRWRSDDGRIAPVWGRLADRTVDLAALLGGIGLFLLGMSMMTDGLKLAAGPALTAILGSWTCSARRGLLAGIFITAVAQSSSATTVAVIGFVNAGLLSLSQAIWVVFGATIGTTTTGWLVAMVGVRFSMTALGLPLIGIGMVLNLLSRDRPRLTGLGRALAGFGAFFMGIGVLQAALAGVDFAIADFVPGEGGVIAMLLFVLAGIVLTLTTQSSSAAIAITLTATAGGAISLEPAAAVIIGANIGTTSTALLAAMGGTPAARRTALSHVAFSLVAGAAAFLFLPAYLWLIAQILAPFGLAQDGITVLAAFHTLLNIAGVLLIWPIAPTLIRFLSGLFVRDEDEIARPHYLDTNLAGTPDLAAASLYLETRRAIGLCMEFARDGVLGGPPRPAEEKRRNIHALMGSIRDFVDGMMSAQPMSEGPAHAVPELVRALQHGEELLILPPAPAEDPLSRPLRDDLVARLQTCLSLPEDGDDGEGIIADAQTAADHAYAAFKDALLHELATAQVTVETVDRSFAWAQALKRTAYVACRARLRLIRARQDGRMEMEMNGSAIAAF